MYFTLSINISFPNDNASDPRINYTFIHMVVEQVHIIGLSAKLKGDLTECKAWATGDQRVTGQARRAPRCPYRAR